MTAKIKQVFLYTNIVLAIFHNEAKALKKLKELEGALFSISHLVYVEVFAGANTDQKAQTHKFLSRFNLVQYDAKAQKIATQLCRQVFLGKSRKPYDLSIAAHALSLGLPIVTNNLKDFDFPGLIVFHYENSTWS
jgi:tRNA(fMet)-specific endonuclease VapC